MEPRVTVSRDFGFGFYEFEGAGLEAKLGLPATDPSWDPQYKIWIGSLLFGESTSLLSVDDPGVVYSLAGEGSNYLYEHPLCKSEIAPVNFKKKG